MEFSQVLASRVILQDYNYMHLSSSSFNWSLIGGDAVTTVLVAGAGLAGAGTIAAGRGSALAGG